MNADNDEIDQLNEELVDIDLIDSFTNRSISSKDF